MSPRTVDLAMIIPVLGDAQPLGALLARVRDWPLQPSEIFVAGAADTAAVEAICRLHASQFAVLEPCRGAQLDAGVRATSAPTLWFVHADADPSFACLEGLMRARARGIEAGYFRFAFSGAPSWRKRVVARLARLRVRCGGVPYGDQGLWMSRQAYIESGGFAHEPLFEEVALVRRLRARGRLVEIDEPIGVSPRRYERDGWLRRCAANRLLAIQHGLGVPADQLATRYHRLTQTTDRSNERTA